MGNVVVFIFNLGGDISSLQLSFVDKEEEYCEVTSDPSISCTS
jgi:hypothetical protein